MRCGCFAFAVLLFVWSMECQSQPMDYDALAPVDMVGPYPSETWPIDRAYFKRLRSKRELFITPSVSRKPIYLIGGIRY
ncbi:unnamed protein product [Calicophoron daubneyi]|uniref:Uncharacterized protein n=1 Tax=Calicophoron daubneyi TaxID=300641 RepID=A0AAV2TB18_CALDB